MICACDLIKKKVEDSVKEQNIQMGSLSANSFMDMEVFVEGHWIVWGLHSVLQRKIVLI